MPIADTQNPQVSICHLHRELYRLANREGILELDLEKLQQIVFPDSAINLKNMLTKLEKYGEITLGTNFIKLTPWPRIGCRNLSPKTERFDRRLWAEPKAVNPKTAKGDAGRERQLICKSGLSRFRFDPAFKAFLQLWPLPTDRDRRKLARREWDRLSQSNALPDISLIILTLKSFPPGPRTWPHTWLKKRPWKKPRVTPTCPTCHDEKIVYGVRPDGTKGAIPCPKCNL